MFMKRFEKQRVGLGAAFALWGVGIAAALAGPLEELKALPAITAKPVYPWQPPDELLLAPTPELREQVRILGGVGLALTWITPEKAAAAIKLVEPYKGRVTLHARPWYEECKALGTPGDCDPRGSPLPALLAFLDRVRVWQAAVAASPYKPTVAIELDSECHAYGADEALNKAIDERLFTYHRFAQALFPGAPVFWYGMGKLPGDAATGTSIPSWTRPATIVVVGASTALYTPAEIELHRRLVREAAALGGKMTVYVTIGRGWQRIRPGGFNTSTKPDGTPGDAATHFWTRTPFWSPAYEENNAFELFNVWCGKPEFEKRFIPNRDVDGVAIYEWAPPDAWFIAWARGATE